MKSPKTLEQPMQPEPKVIGSYKKSVYLKFEGLVNKRCDLKTPVYYIQ